MSLKPMQSAEAAIQKAQLSVASLGPRPFGKAVNGKNRSNFFPTYQSLDPLDHFGSEDSILNKSVE
jgi:hypothetical protein